MSTKLEQNARIRDVRRFGKRVELPTVGIVTSTLTASTRKGGSPSTDFPTGGLLFDRLCISGLCQATATTRTTLCCMDGWSSRPGPRSCMAPSYLSALRVMPGREYKLCAWLRRNKGRPVQGKLSLSPKEQSS